MLHFSLSGLIFNSWCVQITSFSLNMCQALDYSFWDEKDILEKCSCSNILSNFFIPNFVLGYVYLPLCAPAERKISQFHLHSVNPCSLPCLSPVSVFFLFIFIFLLYLVLDFLIRGLYFLFRSFCLLRSVRISTNGETNQKGIQILIVCQ